MSKLYAEVKESGRKEFALYNYIYRKFKRKIIYGDKNVAMNASGKAGVDVVDLGSLRLIKAFTEMGRKRKQTFTWMPF
jgi:hypothetical protein